MKSLMELPKFNKDLDEYETEMGEYSFFMYRYKTSWCPKLSKKHDWA